MYNNITELLTQAETSKLPLHEVILQNEQELTEVGIDNIYKRLEASFEVMKKSANKALNTPLCMPGNLISGQASLQFNYADKATLSGTEINTMMAYAFSCSEVNASMGRICAAPTAGACGIVPAVLLTVQKRLNSSHEEVLNALAVASGFGAIIMKNATVSGAEGGCQAECGTAAAMAATGAVYLAKGTNQMCATAVAIALMNCMGLICDPVAGLVQLPCSYRNASQSVNALTSADMALAGQNSVIPADEVIDAMYRTGKKLPSDFRETALGGIAATKRGVEITKEIFNK